MAPGSKSKIEQKRKRKVLTLHEKMTILKQIEQGRKYASLAREYNLNESSIRTIKKCESKIQASVRLLSNPKTVKSTHITRRDCIMEQMEHLLNIWIDDQEKKNVPLTSTMIRNEALSIYERLKSQRPECDNVESSFCASKGWFYKFKKRAKLHCLALVTSDEALVDGEGGDNHKKTACWTKVSHEEDGESQQQQSLGITKIINLSNLIKKEVFTDTAVYPVLSGPEKLKLEEAEEVEDDFEKFKSEEEKEEDLEDDFPKTGQEKKKIGMTSRKRAEILQAAEFFKEKILLGDPDIERSIKFRNVIDNIIKSYTNVNEVKQEAEMPDTATLSVPDSEAVYGFGKGNVKSDKRLSMALGKECEV